MKKYFLMLCIAALLAGCAGVPVQKPSELAATHGYVYVNLPKGGYGESLMIQPLQGGKWGKELGLIARKDPNVRAFGRWVPAGEYRISKWEGYKVSGYPNFTVKAGHLTDLGSLIPFNIGGYEVVVLPVRHPETAKDVSLALGEHKPFLVSMEPIEWQPQAPPKPFKLQQQSSGLGLIADLISQYERNLNKPSMNKQLREAASIQDFFRLAKASTPPLTYEPGVDAQSNLYYGADFGQIRVRNPAGEWTAIDTGSLRKVTAVKVAGELIIAGFDNGKIRSSTNGGKVWKEISSLNPDETVVDIDKVADSWLVTTARMVPSSSPGLIPDSPDQVSVYMGKRNDFSDLSNIKRITAKTGNNAFWGVWGEAAGNFYYVNAQPDFMRLNVESKEWKTITPWELVTGFHISPETHTLSSYGIKGFSSKLYVSADYGENWIEYATPPFFIRDIYFEDKNKGRAVRGNRHAFSVTMELMEFDPKKNVWMKTGETPAGCNEILRDTNYAPRFCVTQGGSILGYGNSQWAVEFSAE